MKIGFLIGAGVSKYANAPSTENITKRLLEDNNIVKHSMGSFHYSDRDDQSKLLITLIQDYLFFLKIFTIFE